MKTQLSASNLPAINHNSAPVITTELLARLYGTEIINIQVNHTRNKDRFVEGKHYFKLEGSELKGFKNRLTESKLVAKNARSLILWTERGAARHAKMLETDQAWDVFEKLEDCYFNQYQSTHQPKPQTHTLILTDEELCALCWLWNAAEYMRERIEAVYPALSSLESSYAGSFYSMAFEYKRTLEAGRIILERETRSIEPHPSQILGSNWRTVLMRIREEKTLRS